MNKKIISAIILATFICNQPVYALEREDQTEQQETENLEGKQTTVPLQEIGLEEAPAPRPVNDSNLKNWLFAAGTIVSATVAILVVSWCPGSPPPTGPHYGPIVR